MQFKKKKIQTERLKETIKDFRRMEDLGWDVEGWKKIREWWWGSACKIPYCISPTTWAQLLKPTWKVGCCGMPMKPALLQQDGSRLRKTSRNTQAVQWEYFIARSSLWFAYVEGNALKSCKFYLFNLGKHGSWLLTNGPDVKVFGGLAVVVYARGRGQR